MRIWRAEGCGKKPNKKTKKQGKKGFNPLFRKKGMCAEAEIGRLAKYGEWAIDKRL